MNQPKRYRKKPIIIFARIADKEEDIKTLEGTMKANPGDYIITGVKGEKYPCKPDIFKETYTVAPETLMEITVFFKALVYLKLTKETTGCIVDNLSSLHDNDEYYPYWYPIKSWHIVTPKTFEQLKAAGEPCIKIADLCIWGETE